MIKSSIVISILSLCISLVSFLNQIIIAKIYGAGHEVDLFFMLTSFPTFVSGLFSAGISYSLTPYLLKEKAKQKGYKIALGELLKRFSLITLLGCIIGAVLFLTLRPYIYPVSSNHNFNVVLALSILAWMTAGFLLLQSFLFSVFNSEEQFLKPVILSAIPPTSSILCTIVGYRFLGIISISLGLFLGTISSLIISLFILKNNISFKSGVENAKSTYLKKLPTAAYAMLCFTIYQTIDSFWAPKLGSSYLAYLSYCQRILIAVGALVITGPSTILIPRLTTALIEKRSEDFFNEVAMVVKLVFIMGAFVAIAGSCLAIPLIRFMFQRGAFSFKDTVAIANILPYMLVGMVFMLCVTILFRVAFIKETGKFASVIGTLSIFLYFSFSGIGSKFLGITGIALAYASTWAILFLISLKQIFKERPSLLFNRYNLLFLGKLSIAIILTQAFVLLISRYFPWQLLNNYDFYKLLIVGSLSLIFYFFISILMKVKEVDVVYTGALQVFKTSLKHLHLKA